MGGNPHWSMGTMCGVEHEQKPLSTPLHPGEEAEETKRQVWKGGVGRRYFKIWFYFLIILI